MKHAAAGVLGWLGGQVIAGIGGGFLIAIGLYQLDDALRGEFAEDVKTPVSTTCRARAAAQLASGRGSLASGTSSATSDRPERSMPPPGTWAGKSTCRRFAAQLLTCRTSIPTWRRFVFSAITLPTDDWRSHRASERAR
jgi:hypothetical protein